MLPLTVAWYWPLGLCVEPPGASTTGKRFTLPERDAVYNVCCNGGKNGLLDDWLAYFNHSSASRRVYTMSWDINEEVHEHWPVMQLSPLIHGDTYHDTPEEADICPAYLESSVTQVRFIRDMDMFDEEVSQSKLTFETEL